MGEGVGYSPPGLLWKESIASALLGVYFLDIYCNDFAEHLRRVGYDYHRFFPETTSVYLDAS